MFRDRSSRPAAGRRTLWCACMAMGTLVCVAACGGSVAAAGAPSQSATRPALPKVGDHAPEEVKGLPILARGTLRGGGRFVLYAEPGETHGGRLLYTAGVAIGDPVRYQPSPEAVSQAGEVKEGLVWGGSRGVSLSSSRDSRVRIVMATESGCIGPHPFLIVYGVVGSAKERVIAEAHGETQAFRNVAVPRKLGNVGRFVYAKMKPGKYRVIFERANGRIVRSVSVGSVVHGPLCTRYRSGKTR